MSEECGIFLCTWPWRHPGTIRALPARAEKGSRAKRRGWATSCIYLGVDISDQVITGSQLYFPVEWILHSGILERSSFGPFPLGSPCLFIHVTLGPQLFPFSIPHPLQHEAPCLKRWKLFLYHLNLVKASSLALVRKWRHDSSDLVRVHLLSLLAILSTSWV